MVLGLTNLGSSFVSAETTAYKARKALNVEINGSRDLSEEEKLSLLANLTYDDSLFQMLSTFPKGTIKTKFMKEHAVRRMPQATNMGSIGSMGERARDE